MKTKGRVSKNVKEIVGGHLLPTLTPKQPPPKELKSLSEMNKGATAAAKKVTERGDREAKPGRVIDTTVIEHSKREKERAREVVKKRTPK